MTAADRFVPDTRGPTQPRTQAETYPPFEEHKRVASNFEATEKMTTTYRLQGISSDVQQKEAIPGLLRKAWGLPGSTAITAHSLATDPTGPGRKTATVTFEETPGFLRSGDRTSWKSPGDSGLHLDTDFHGLTPLHSDVDSDCILDVIAVSGHAFGSFNCKKYSFMWLRDGLPRDLRQTRIFVYGYDTKKSSQSVMDHGSKLRDAVKGLRPSGKDPLRPLIFIGHSLGGMVVKQAIIDLHGSSENDDKMNFESLRAIFFFGVPNLGANTESFMDMAEGKPCEKLVQFPHPRGDGLRWQQRYFAPLLRKFARYWYYETTGTRTPEKTGSGWAMTGSPQILVDMQSATNGLPMPWEQDEHFVYPINHNHSELVRFPDRGYMDYGVVCRHLDRVKEAVLQSQGDTSLSDDAKTVDWGVRRVIADREMPLPHRVLSFGSE
ncbi:ankyrin repeat-containing protein [Diplodia corticola]|uniref:Ankyrin repeat-containing protein n=1 Tax=Diplodia corticola TaxID=236234 RepID=A0A1J9QYF4_9PEZI|nr:ankyrin repeat-containing protein [Diplodia corticola]OJD34078.1 ankyrin repeat-containing protein [Diplodia corticola]